MINLTTLQLASDLTETKEMESNPLIEQNFERLKNESNQTKIRQIIDEIWELWLTSRNPEIEFLMERGCELTAEKKYEEAVNCFTEIIEKDPNYVEGWNKRGTAHYLEGNYEEAISDIQRTLEIEPRHFGALSGLATIYLILNNHQGALSTFRKLHDIYPHRKNLKSKIACLEEVVQGQN